ncbi:MAG: nucleotidyltransferase family protein [Gemmataceae bacterium]
MDTKDLTPLLLAGGLGTRLRDALPGVPKVLAPVAGRPFVTHLLDQLAAAGFREAVLLTGHLHDEVVRELGDSYRGVRLSYSRERQPLGTGGAIRAALPAVRSARLLVMNGDSFVDQGLADLPWFHARRGGAVTLVLTRVEDAGRYGKVRLGERGEVVAFEEKAPGAGPGWVNAGVYLFDREVVESVPIDGPVSLEREVLPEWVSRGRVFGLRSPGRFLDIGTPESLATAGEFFLGVEQGVLSHAR